MNISDQIQKAIESQLPKEVGDVLSKRLAWLDEVETEVGKLTKYNQELRESLQRANDQLASHADLYIRETEVTQREKEVTEREIKMDVHDAVKRAENAEKIAENSKEFVSLVFKSPVYRKTTHKGVGVPNGGYVANSYDTEEETID